VTNSHNRGVDIPFPLLVTCTDSFNEASNGNGKFGGNMGGIKVPEFVTAVFDRRHRRKRSL
jgi:hypothetical protein